MLANAMMFVHNVGAILMEATQIITTSALEPVGEGMKAAVSAALPVGVGVFAVTAGIPIAKKVIKQLGR